MMKKMFIFLVGVLSFLVMGYNVNAAEEIEINNQADYFNAISTINESTDGEFIVSLGADVILDAYPSTPNPITITNGNTVTIIGNGHKIKIKETDEYGYHSILTVDDAIVNLGLEDGSDTLYIEGGGPEVSTSESLINVGGTLNIYDGVDIGNNHSGHGGLSGGAIRFRPNGTVNMYGGRIHDNSSDASCIGGAVMIDQGNATFNMYDGIFENNSVCAIGTNGYGGAILLMEYSGTSSINITGGTFKNNSARHGGAIVNIYGTLNVSNAVFEGNTAWYEEEELDEIDPEYVEIAGGAIVQYSPTAAIIDNCTFKNNKAKSGGAIHAWGARTVVTNSTFENNEATDFGGAVFVDELGVYYSEENTYTGNTAQYGGVAYNKKTLYLINDEITDNKASKVGGAAYLTGTYNVVDAYAYNNKATEAANDIYVSALAKNTYLKDPEEMSDDTVAFDGKNYKVNSWLTDDDEDRYSSTNVTTVIEFDNDDMQLDNNTEYFITAGRNKKVLSIKFSIEGVDIDDIILEEGESLPEIEEPTREGYTFDGWYTSNSYTEEFDFDEEITDDVTIYGNWVSDSDVLGEITTNNPPTGDKVVFYILMIIIVVGGLVTANIFKKKLS